MEARRRSFAETARKRSSTVEIPRTERGMSSKVHLLSYELYVASIPKDTLSSTTHSLLRILLELFQEDSECRRYACNLAGVSCD